VRSIEECRNEARNDLTVITNLIEARLLCGNVDLLKQMQSVIAPSELWSSQEFFDAKCKEQRLRHLRYHETAYNLEPNVKEGPGGLRDIQMVGWIAKRHFNVDNLHDLVYHGFLSEDEYRALMNAREFLWRIRCHLHALARRREDRLIFDYQRTLAHLLGYHDKDHHLGVELFMREYYCTVRRVSMLNELILQLFYDVIVQQKNTKIIPINRRFQICNDYIEAVHDKVFIVYPFALLEIFLLIQQNTHIQGIRAETIRLILAHVHLIDSAFHEDLRARSLFHEIITQPEGQTRAFRLMSRYEVLPSYLPAFGKIVGQMQYDLFHTYTVDQHTLFVIRNLRRLALPEYVDELPLCSEIMQDLPKQELLYLAGLFHDIAKGRGGDHSVLGQQDAIDFCLAHGFSDQDARFVGWLVRHHLLMSVTVQRQDIDDPEVVFNFARIMGDITHLQYLYLLTVADIRATSPKLWNAWKNSLLAALYHKTRQVLLQGMNIPIDRKTRIQEIKAQALRLLDESCSIQVKALWDNIQDEYFLRSAPVDIACETHMILAKGEALPLVIVRKEARGGTGLLIYAQARDDLFVNTTRYLEQEDLSVVSASLTITETNAIILNFTVLESNGQPLEGGPHLESIVDGLRDTVLQKALLFCPLKRLAARQLRHFPVPTRVSFSRDGAYKHTVMEVVTTDRPGVLSHIAQALYRCRVRVSNAKIATFGSRVEDIFFITDEFNAPLKSAEQFDALREQLILLLDTPAENMR
jgi:[protein-PII] uridylyltransferase